MNKDVSAWQKLAGRIFNIDFNEQRTGGNIDGVGVANESAMKSLAREFIEGQGGWRTGAGGAGVHLGYRDVQPELLYGRDVKEFPRLRAGPSVDECSNVRIARRDDAVEGGIDLLKRLQLLQASYIRSAGCGRCFHRAEITDRLVGFLLGHGARAHQVKPAVRGDLGNVQVGLRGIQLRLSLLQLLVDFGSFDLREQLAFLDMRADVEIPALEIATGSRINRSVAECLCVAGQYYFLSGGAFSRKNHG